VIVLSIVNIFGVKTGAFIQNILRPEGRGAARVVLLEFF